MLYRVTVAGPLGQQDLDFLLDENPLVDLWLDCVRTQLAKPWHIGSQQWTRTWATAEDLEHSQQELRQIALDLGLNPDQDLDGLKSQFHETWVEAEGKSSPLWEIFTLRMQRVEEQTHSLDRAFLQRTGFGFNVCDTETGLLEQRIITRDLRKYWAHVPRNGELLLGYYSLGKTIADCQKDNDINCVRQLRVAAQMDITTEVVCLWSPAPASLKPIPPHSVIKKWVEDNQLSEYINLDLQEHQYHGTPRLGEYVGTLTDAELNELMKGARVVEAALID